MTKPLILASLLTAAITGSIAAAAPTPPTPPPAPVGAPPPMCKASGDVLFTSDVILMSHNKLPTTHIKLFTSGAWRSAVTNADGSRGREASGCLPADKLATIVDDLDKAPWTTTTPTYTCAAIGATYTEYTRRGKAVWTDSVCSGPILDEVSQRKLNEVIAILADVSKPSAIETSRGKP